MKLLPLHQSLLILLFSALLSSRSPFFPATQSCHCHNKSREQGTALQQGNLPVIHIHFSFVWLTMPSRSKPESLFFTLSGLLDHHSQMTPGFSRVWAGRPGKQHRAEGAGGSGVCGEREGEHPQMQKDQKDQQAGERQDTHHPQTDLLSLFPPLFLLCPPPNTHTPPFPAPSPPRTRPLLGGDDRPYRVQCGTLGRLCGEGSVRH